MTRKELISRALRARENAYAPYSHFAVGAALLCEDGSIYEGCNVENASFSPTCCAERTAIFKAISEGKRHFRTIAVVGGPQGQAPARICPPCGVCRQVLSEFCQKDFEILLWDGTNEICVCTLAELLPHSFSF